MISGYVEQKGRGQAKQMDRKMVLEEPVGQILHNREQANDGLWVAHAELPSPPGGKPRLRTHSHRAVSQVSCGIPGTVPAEDSRSTGSNVQRESRHTDASPLHHFLFYLVHTHTHKTLTLL